MSPIFLISHWYLLESTVFCHVKRGSYKSAQTSCILYSWMGDCRTEEGLSVVSESVGYVCYIKKWKFFMKYFGNAKFSINLKRLKRILKEEREKLGLSYT
jgi:hypothetical protein